MKTRRITHIAILGLIAFATASVARGDGYNVSGTFKSVGFSGPLNGGSFVGTFTATLPLPSLGETITTFDIQLLNSSDVVLDTLTGFGGGVAGAAPVSSTCNVGGSTTGSCDVFQFLAADGSFLELTTPLDFTGGSVFVATASLGDFASFAGILTDSASTDSLVRSGSITPTPEPDALYLLGTGLFGLAAAVRGRRRV